MQLIQHEVNTNSKSEMISLFVEGNPIIFELKRKREVFYFEPLISWKDAVEPETFYLERANNNWQVSAAIDCDLYHQAVEVLESRYLKDN
jgi:hypothetical protein